MLNRTHKWIAVGIIAIASIPAVTFARPHKPTQAAPSMSAVSATPIVAAAVHTATKPKHLNKSLHKKLHAKRKAHTSLKHTGTHAKKLTHSSRKHTKLHATKKKTA